MILPAASRGRQLRLGSILLGCEEEIGSRTLVQDSHRIFIDWSFGASFFKTLLIQLVPYEYLQ